MYFAFVFCVWMLISMWQMMVCQDELFRPEIRLTKAANCNVTGLKWIFQNITVFSQYPKIYLSARFNIIDEIKTLKKVHFHIERCNEQGYECEDFQNWNIERFCPMMILKNQIWSEFVSRIRPSFRCPTKKSAYELRNASLNLDAIMKWYPEMHKYKWNTSCKIFNEYDNVIFCGIFESYLQLYRKQNGKPPRRHRNTSLIKEIK